jgi:hypothetical protein
MPIIAGAVIVAEKKKSNANCPADKPKTPQCRVRRPLPADAIAYCLPLAMTARWVASSLFSASSTTRMWARLDYSLTPSCASRSEERINHAEQIRPQKAGHLLSSIVPMTFRSRDTTCPGHRPGMGRATPQGIGTSREAECAGEPSRRAIQSQRPPGVVYHRANRL